MQSQIIYYTFEKIFFMRFFEIFIYILILINLLISLVKRDFGTFFLTLAVLCYYTKVLLTAYRNDKY